jgi:hypothetical protein
LKDLADKVNGPRLVFEYHAILAKWIQLDNQPNVWRIARVAAVPYIENYTTNLVPSDSPRCFSATGGQSSQVKL